MIRGSKIFSVGLTIVMALSLIGPASAAGKDESEAAPDKQPFFAVMVGIDDYLSDAVDDLSGCKNDVDDLKSVLVKNYRLPDDKNHILVLKDRQATKKAIKDGFRQMLISNAEKYGDKGLYLFQYSGHGSYCDDTNNDELGPYDQTLVSADSRQGDVFDLVDDEIEELVKELTSKTKNAVLIFDCCHSYTNTRGGKVRARQLQPDKRPQPKQSEVAKVAKTRGGDSESPKATVVPRDQRYVVFSGCLQDETSGETSDTEGRTNGLLTRHLVLALEKAGSDTTYRQLWDTVSKGVNSENWGQHPQVEGDLERPILNATAVRVEPGIKVSKTEEKSAVIEAGAVHRIVEVGALVAFYKPNAKKLEGEQDLLAKGFVAKVGKLKSEVDLDRKVDPEILAQSKARIVTPYGGDKPLRVSVEQRQEGKGAQSLFGSLDKLHKDELAKLKSGDSDASTSKLLELNYSKSDPLDAERGWDVAVIKDTFSKFKLARRNVGSKARETEPAKDVFFIAAENGMPLFDLWIETEDPEAPSKIYSALKKRARQRLIQSLENKVSPLDGKLKVEFVRVTGWDTDLDGNPSGPKTETRIADQIGAPIVKEGEQFLLKLTNASDKPLYPTVVSLGSSGKIDIIYPLNSTHQDPLQPDKSMKTDVMEASAPVGPECFKIIVTTNPTDFSFLSQEGVREVTRKAAIVNPLEKLLEDRHNGTRDSTVVKTPTLDDWATSEIDIVVRAK